MTTGYLTQSQLVELKLMADKATLDTTRISDLIKSDLATDYKQNMKSGVDYYNSLHDILDHLNYYTIDGQKQVDKVKANNKTPHPFHKILVDQKTAYVAGNPIAITVSSDDEKVKEYQKELTLQLDESFDDLVNEWIKGSSNKGIEWVHFYVDGKGNLNYCIVPAQQIIAVYDTQYQDDLVYVIRFYVYDLISATGETQQRYKVEWWTKEKVEYWVQTENSQFIHDASYPINPAPHWYSFNTEDESQREDISWGKVPFVPLQNNSENQSDLHPVKPLIDAYDKVKSGWLNDLDDFAQLIYILKGFQGLRNETSAGYSELGLFISNLKNDKAIAVESDGAVSTLKTEIPVEAREKFLKLTRQEIFYFGEGVDVGDEKNIGQAPSGIALKFLYASLDLKANRLIRKLKTSLKEFVWFVTEYINITKNKEYDYEQISFTINKSQIFNEKEKIDGLVASNGMLSKKTILENHPYVDDVSEEMKRLADEKK